MTVLTAGAIIPLLTHSLPLAPLQVDNARIDQTRLSYSVVPVHGDFGTSADAPQVIVTVAGPSPPPVTVTVTVSDSETTIFASTTMSSKTDPIPTLTDTPPPTALWLSQTTSSAIQFSSTPGFVVPSHHSTSSFRPSWGVSTPYATPTSMIFYSPTLPPVII